MSQVKDLVDAIDAFIVGCKDDAIWDAIKACCIMAAWDGLSGCLVPLKGTAPTNNNFVSGDYNRKTGLVGDGATKYLNSNRANNADPQNSNHNAVYATTVATGLAIHGGELGSTGSNQLGLGGRKSRNTNAISGINMSIGFAGINRTVSANFVYRTGGASTTASQSSELPDTNNVFLFAAFVSGEGFFGTHRLSFYSIGEALDLALLDSRVSTLMTAIGAAIP